MKTFELNPRSEDANDPYAKAARFAMLKFAEVIGEHDPILGKELIYWAGKEFQRAEALDPTKCGPKRRFKNGG